MEILRAQLKENVYNIKDFKHHMTVDEEPEGLKL